MGDGIVGHISKGPVHTRVDEYVNHRDAKGQFDNRAGFLDKLINHANSSTEYLQILQTDVGVPYENVEYLRRTWYNRESNSDPYRRGWWLHLQPIYPILHAGLIRALQEAGQNL